MTQQKLLHTAILAGLIVGAAGAATAQVSDTLQPWKGPNPPPAAETHKATSSLDATQPNAADVHQTRALAGAVFAQPAAAQRAADKAADAVAPITPTVEPKPEWTDQSVRLGNGKAITLSAPF